MTFFNASNLFRSTLRHDGTTTHTAFGPEIDNPIGRLDDIEIVLDHEHGIATINQFVQHIQEDAHILEVQSGCWLIQNVQRTTVITF